MKKGIFLKNISERSGISMAQCKIVIDSMVDELKDLLLKDDFIVFKRFGSFSIRNRKARKGVNPANGKSMTIPAKKVVKFCTSNIFTKTVNR
jgi:DNA-binding protein HU-beta